MCVVLFEKVYSYHKDQLWLPHYGLLVYVEAHLNGLHNKIKNEVIHEQFSTPGESDSGCESVAGLRDPRTAGLGSL